MTQSSTFHAGVAEHLQGMSTRLAAWHDHLVAEGEVVIKTEALSAGRV